MLDTDTWHVGRLVAEHFIDIGFRNFAYVGYTGIDFSKRRLCAFEDFLRKQGHTAAVYTSSFDDARFTDVLDWETRGGTTD